MDRISGQKPSLGLPVGTSVYLDAVRLLASLAVVLTHAKALYFDRIPWIISMHSREAVAAFFVLSGFVIAFVAQGKEHEWRKYSVARMSRIYSVVIISLLITFIFDEVGSHLFRASYLKYQFFHEPTVLSLLTYLTFTNKIWMTHFVFGSAEPYWSLGYEIPYYILFGIISFCPKKWKVLVVAIWAAIFGPKIIAYALLWGLGVLTFNLRPIVRKFITPWIATLIFILALASYWLAVLYMSHIAAVSIYKLGDIRQEIKSFLYFMLIGVVIAVSILSIDAAVANIQKFPAFIVGSIRWLAGGSFTLYVLHLPLMAFLVAAFPQAGHSRVTGAAILVAVLVACYAAAELGERRKRFFARIFGQLFLHSKGAKVG